MAPADDNPTLAVLQTPPGLAGIAVITLQGPEDRRILDCVFQPVRPAERWQEDRIRLGHVHGPGGPIDQALACLRSDCVELNLHGGPAATSATMQLLADNGATPGSPAGRADPALPWAHPRMNNPAVGREVLGLLAEARTSLASRVLSSQWSGGISRLARQVLAAETPTAEMAQALRKAAAGLQTVRRLLLPAELVLIGPPNAGKSTLANRLTARPVSLVDPQPGTTRDWVREEAEIGGADVWVTDTAGIWDAPARIDAEAVRRVRPRTARADVICMLSPGAKDPTPGWVDPARCIRVASQADRNRLQGPYDVAVSAQTGEGLDELTRQILARLELADIDAAEARAVTARQQGLAERAAEAIHADQLARATAALGELLGSNSR
jgi:tRNA modification GTPase